MSSQNSLQELAARVAEKNVSKRFSAPSYMELFLTEGCNLRCSYCFVKEKTGRRMTEDIARRAVDLLMTLSRNTKKIGLLYFGGEPLTRFDLIVFTTHYALDQAAKYGKEVSFSMTTNGTIATERYLRFMKEYDIRYLVSVDGLAHTHDVHRRTAGGDPSYAKIVANLTRFKRHQPWLGVRYTVVPEGAHELLDGIRFLANRGVNQFIVGPAHGVRWSDESLDAYAKSVYEVADWYVEEKGKKAPLRISLFEDRDGRGAGWGCGAGRGRISVTAGGDLYGCSKLVTVNGLREEGLGKYGNVWDGITDWHARQMITDGTSNRRHECRQCAYRHDCTGGCPAVNYEATGNAFLPDDMFCKLMPLLSNVQDYVAGRLHESGKTD